MKFAEFEYMTLDLLQTFKVKVSKVKGTEQKCHQIAKLLLSLGN